MKTLWVLVLLSPDATMAAAFPNLGSVTTSLTAQTVRTRKTRSVKAHTPVSRHSSSATTTSRFWHQSAVHLWLFSLTICNQLFLYHCSCFLPFPPLCFCSSSPWLSGDTVAKLIRISSFWSDVPWSGGLNLRPLFMSGRVCIPIPQGQS